MTDRLCIVNQWGVEFQKIYDRLDIKLTEKGESFYQTRMEKIVEDLQKAGFLELDDGRKIMWGKL